VVHLGGESAKYDNDITDSGRQVEPLQIESELLYFRKNHGVIAVFLYLLLTTLGDLILPLKRAIKGRFPVGWKSFAKHVRMYWALGRKTRFGSRPIR